MAPRMYFALDAGFTSSAAIEQLGERHRSAGPMVVISLLGMAKNQGAGGAARTTAKKLAADAFLTGGPDQARQIVLDAAEVGTLEVVEIGDRVIHVKFVRWQEWQPRLAAAERAAKSRAKQKSSGTDEDGDEQ
jgi:hypothetical protein